MEDLIDVNPNIAEEVEQAERSSGNESKTPEEAIRKFVDEKVKFNCKLKSFSLDCWLKIFFSFSKICEKNKMFGNFDTFFEKLLIQIRQLTPFRIL